MIVGIDAGRDDGAKCRCLARRKAGCIENPCRLDFEVDRTILMKIPEQSVFIVAHGRDRRHDQPPGAPDVDLAGEEIRMLPEDSEILLMQAHGALDAVGVTLAVRQPGVEIANGAETVAA